VSIDASQLPLAVEGGSGGSVVGDPSAELVEVTESGFLSQRFALWFIAAVLVAALGAYAVVRLVVFRDN
jgi:hypothetical protein